MRPVSDLQALQISRKTKVERWPRRSLPLCAQHVIALLVFTALIAGLYFSVLTGHAAIKTNVPWPSGPLFVSDPMAGGPITLPMEHLVAHAWRHLQAPIMDPFQGFGITLLANQGVPTFFPEIMTHLATSNNYSLWDLIRLMLIPFGFYLLATSFGQPFMPALAVGASVALAGIVPVNVNLGMLNPVLVYPYVLLSLRYLLDPRSRHVAASFLGVTSATSLLLLSGFQEVFPLMAVSLALYAAFLVFHYHTLITRPIRLIVAAAGVLTGAVIGIAGIVPLLVTIGQGGSLNPANSFAMHAPPFWLSTLTVPSVVKGAMSAQPIDLGQSVWALGSPFLVLVLVLGAAVGIRSGSKTRWYVIPSMAVVLFGLLGFIDAGGTLRVFEFGPLRSIAMVRFLPFLWWPSWCLLLGAVITHVKTLRWWHLVMGGVIAGVFDWVTIGAFRDALAAAHLSSQFAMTLSALRTALVFVILFSLVATTWRWGTAGWGLTALVVASLVVYLPMNLFPPSGNVTVRSLPVPRSYERSQRYLAYDTSALQLPTEGFTVEVYSPLVPESYRRIVDALVPVSHTTDRMGATNGIAPLLYYAIVDRHFVQVLHELGVNILVSPQPLPTATVGSVPACDQDRTKLLCVEPRTKLANAADASEHVYVIRSTDPLIAPVSHVFVVENRSIALHRMAEAIKGSRDSLGTTAFVSTGPDAMQSAPAIGARGLRRAVTTENVTDWVRVRKAGLIVLRSAYEAGMSATVDGQQRSVVPVDGGLWSAVDVPVGKSEVSLNYRTAADSLELLMSEAGLVLLAASWVLVAAWAAASKRRSHSLAG